MNDKLRKLLRFVGIYGFRRTLVKTLGRFRSGVSVRFLFPQAWLPKQKRVLLIGCGQFGYASIGFFLAKEKGFVIRGVYDPDANHMNTFANSYGQPLKLDETLISEVSSKDYDLAYIASNHSTHTEYACELMAKGINVYIEKPIAVNWEQFTRLKSAQANSESAVYVGYNRPFSAAIIEACNYLENGKPITLNGVIAGHLIGPDHWYRDPKEGTRVCGNLGHWLDLGVHLLFATGGFSELDITVIYSDTSTPDDNLSVVLTTPRGDLITLSLTARDEPFEGINENIFLQQDGLLVKIDDFRSAEFQRGSKKHTRHYRPKDVGHKKAILQPFRKDHARNFAEVVVSTSLMLEITDMVRSQTTQRSFKVD